VAVMTAVVFLARVVLVLLFWIVLTALVTP
jgi:hypothetical protein